MPTNRPPISAPSLYSPSGFDPTPSDLLCGDWHRRPCLDHLGRVVLAGMAANGSVVDLKKGPSVFRAYLTNQTSHGPSVSQLSYLNMPL